MIFLLSKLTKLIIIIIIIKGYSHYYYYYYCYDFHTHIELLKHITMIIYGVYDTHMYYRRYLLIIKTCLYNIPYVDDD